MLDMRRQKADWQGGRRARSTSRLGSEFLILAYHPPALLTMLLPCTFVVILFKLSHSMKYHVALSRHDLGRHIG
jgi:hypothetical protein